MVNGGSADPGPRGRAVPRGSEVRVWIVDVDDGTPLADALAVLPPGERERLGRLIQPHRGHNIRAQAALRTLTAAAAGGLLPLPELVRAPSGKPVLEAWGAAAVGPGPGRDPRSPRLHVSLAHSGGLAAVALTTAGVVGVDLERLRPLVEQEGMARVTLADTEYAEWAEWRESSPADRTDLLSWAWTRKEAVLKALGTGLAGDLRAVATRLAGPATGAVRVTALPEAAGRPEAWTVRDLPVAEGFAGSLAVAAPRAGVVRHRTTTGALLAAAGGVGSALGTVPGAAGGPRLRLFCLPDAGGHAHHAVRWSPRLPVGVALTPVDLPGHGTRLREPLVDEWPALIGDLAERLAREIDGPWAVLGHGFGALLAVEVSRVLEGEGRTPELLILLEGGAASGAHAGPHQQAMGVRSPALRADLRLAERYRPGSGPRLSCPVLAIADQGARSTGGGPDAWARAVGGRFERVRVTGQGRQDGWDEVVRIVGARLGVLVDGGQSRSVR
ncbi:thioesterase domain-containing protein [Streptomyces diastatochromogenes]|uniref:thioesterase domain-containing protein n=1 Tax=Streptomyces diastatochromogenes TaxID=42236 RepID=UPI0036C5EBCF